MKFSLMIYWSNYATPKAQAVCKFENIHKPASQFNLSYHRDFIFRFSQVTFWEPFWNIFKRNYIDVGNTLKAFEPPNLSCDKCTSLILPFFNWFEQIPCLTLQEQN